MDFNYFEATRKHLYSFYDGVTMSAVFTYKEQDFLIHSYDFDDFKKISYMLMPLSTEEIEEFKRGAKSFFEKKFKNGELFMYTFSMIEGYNFNEVRLITKEEAEEGYPLDDYITDFEYDEHYAWVY